MKNLQKLAAVFFIFISVFTSCNKNDGLIESPQREIGLTGTFDEIQNGVWVLMTYDAKSDSFVGTVENTTTKAMENVHLEIHLSSGEELAQATTLDLAVGEMKAVKISANAAEFEEWSPRAFRD